MKLRSQTSRILKWTGTVGCLFIAAVFLVSGWYALRAWAVWRDSRFDFLLNEGSVTISRLQLCGGSGRNAPSFDFDQGQHAPLTEPSFSFAVIMPSAYP